MTFRIVFPGSDPGDQARALLPDIVQKSHDRLRTCGHAAETSAPIATRIE